MTSPQSANVPRIRIAPTLANDLTLMLQLLPFTRELASFVADPRGFVREHRAELRFLDQLGRAQIKRLRLQTHEPAAVVENEASSPAEPPAPARRQMVMLR